MAIGHEYSYSFPLIFFNVEDFEDAFSSIIIGENEYLCVELRVRLPPAEGSLTGHDRHIVIFQGAVAWDAINTTFQKQTTAKSICTRRHTTPMEAWHTTNEHKPHIHLHSTSCEFQGSA